MASKQEILEKLDFQKVAIDNSPLFNPNSFPNRDKIASDLTYIALWECNGCIAGGSARYLYDRIFDDEIFAFQHKNVKFHRQNDIDFFFKTEQAFEKFLNLAKEKCGIELSVSNGGFCREYRLSYLSKISYCPLKKMQFVKGHFGEPEEILASFDFLNPMVAFDKNYIYFSPLIKNLSYDSVVVVNFKEGLILGRLAKYCQKYGQKIVFLFPEDEPLMRKYLNKEIANLLENPVIEKLEELKYPLKILRMNKKLNPQQLLTLSTYLDKKSTNYKEFFKEFLNQTNHLSTNETKNL